ncbi:MAG: DUF401 family protein [Desulfurococcales archaeon]|nr:DUF401 family protein [Desulfurococcales archaeon]
MPLNPVYGFIASYILLVILASRIRKVYIVIAGMIATYVLLSATPREAVEAGAKLLEWNDLRVFVYIFLSMLLAGLMKETGLLDEMVESLSSSSCRLALTGVPALIGLMPMPGGALVSAIALKDKYLAEARVSRDDATYLNYWFRHVWVPSWPLFQSVVITASVLYINPIDVVSHTWIGTVAAILGGALISYPILRSVSCGGGRGTLAVFLASISPLLGLVILFFSGVPMLVALATVIIVFVAIWRPGRPQLVRALKLATRPTIHLVLLESLYFKNVLLATDMGVAMASFADTAGINEALLVFMVPFILGLAAGGENFFASTAMPALIPYLTLQTGINWSMLALAYLGGFLGVMGSPVHLCLALTVDYFESSMGRVLLKTYASILAAVAIGVAMIYLIY